MRRASLTTMVAEKTHDVEAAPPTTQRANDDEIGTVQVENFGGTDDLKLAREQQHVGTLNRRLKARHVQFLALSGAIGTGLFVGSGQALSLAGPLSCVLAYLITGFNLYCVINSLGEMATWLPLPGAVSS